MLSAVLLLTVVLFAAPNKIGDANAAQLSESVCKYEAENAQSDGKKVPNGFGGLLFTGEAYLLEATNSITFTLDIAESGLCFPI